MAFRTWQQIHSQYCGRVGEEVQLEVDIVYPAEHMPDQPGRVMAHRCSHGLQCNLINKAACVWAGTNPAYDPFVEKA
jgi:hypothetical protein